MIDSPSFPVLLRLFLLSIASEGMYLLLAEQYRETVPFFLLWTALFIGYAFAARTVQGRTGRGLSFFILATSALFRLSLLLQVQSLPAGSPEAFLQAASPIRAAMELRPDLQRLVAVAFDLGALTLMPALLRTASLPTGLALVYGWNPLLVKEGAANGRLEAVPLFLLLLAFLLLQKKRPGVSALAYGASLAGPPFFWATLPLAARALGARLALSLLVAALAWAPLAAKTSFGALMGWPPEDFVGGSLMPAASTLAKLLVTREPIAPFLFCAGAFLVLSLLRTMKLGAEGARFPQEAVILLGGFLFLAPQVMPWAFVPIAGLAAVSANPGWIVATATAPLTYLALRDGSWSFWLAFAQYFPVYASLGFAALGTKRRGRRGARPGKAKTERLPRKS